MFYPHVASSFRNSAFVQAISSKNIPCGNSIILDYIKFLQNKKSFLTFLIYPGPFLLTVSYRMLELFSLFRFINL